MRIGGPFSLILHIGFAAAGVAFAPQMMPTSEPAPYIPIDLVKIADETNLTEVIEAPKEEAAAEEDLAEAEAAPPPPPPPPEPEEVILPAETPPPNKPPEAEKKPEAKPPPAPREEAFDSALKDILAAANSAPKKGADPAPARKRADLANVGEAAREGYGNRRENTASITAFITQQLRDNGCWGDQDDLAGAQSLKATIRVKFRRDGKFDGEINLIEPGRQPSQGPFLVYINRAFAALRKCEEIGFRVPAEYFKSQPPPYIDIEFLP